LILSDITLERMTRCNKLGLALYRAWFAVVVLEAFITILWITAAGMLPICRGCR
jgi:hypothetical protein